MDAISFRYDKFTLQGTFMADTPAEDSLIPPQFFFFICPADFELNCGLPVVQVPGTGQAYWSSDPLGSGKFSTDIAVLFDLPELEFRSEACHHSFGSHYWDILRKVHQNRGFDPDTQDVARHLNYPLFKFYPEPIIGPRLMGPCPGEWIDYGLTWADLPVATGAFSIQGLRITCTDLDKAP